MDIYGYIMIYAMTSYYIFYAVSMQIYADIYIYIRLYTVEKYKL